MSTQRPSQARGKTTPASTPGSFTTHTHGAPDVDLTENYASARPVVDWDNPTYEMFGLGTRGVDVEGNAIHEGNLDDGRSTFAIATSPLFVRVDMNLTGDEDRPFYDVASWTMNGGGGLDARDLAKAVRDCQYQVSERVGFERAARHWLADTDASQRQIDRGSGSIMNFDPDSPVTVGLFSRVNDLDDYDGSPNAVGRPALAVRLTGPEGPGSATWSIVKDRDGCIRYYRGTDPRPLERWEEQALDTEVARRLGQATYGPNQPVLRHLLNDSIGYAHAADAEIGLPAMTIG